MESLKKFQFCYFGVVLLLASSETCYAACTETANRLSSTLSSICTANNATYTQNTIGQPVFNAATNSTINANSPVTLINTLAGQNGIGARAQSGGRINFNGLVTLETGQDTGDTEGSEGLIALDNSTITINAGANITTHGSNSFLAPQQNNGISSRGGGGNSLIEVRGPLQLDINGYDSEAITATATPSNRIIIHDNASILMRGTNSRGLHVNDGGTIISEGTISIRHEGTSFFFGTPSIGVYATSSATGAGSIVLNNVDIVTINPSVNGVVANGSTGNVGTPTITITGTANINILGNDALGVGANERGIVTINNANITASGTNGIGIGTRDNNGIITISSGQINANLYAVAMLDGNNQRINLSNITLIAGDDVINVDTSIGANLQITQGTATAAPGQLLLNVINNSNFTGIFSQSVFNGDVFVENGSTSNLSLLSNTLLTGRMNGGNTFIDPSSRWLMTANSNISTMNNNGIIDFGSYSGAYKQLLTNNNYTTNNGAIYLNTSLGADNSPTDLLRVQGNTGGTGFVRVTNTNGIGALTQEGIKIIDVVGTSNATFQLLGDYIIAGEPAVVSGAYAYRLYKNGISTPADGDWYLRSNFGSGPLYQPGVPIYEAYTGILQLFNRLDTLQQRVGNRSWLSPQKTSNLIEGNGFWTRIEGMQASFEPKFSTVPFDYQASLLKYTLGIDKCLLSNSTGVLVAGLAGHYGKVFSDIYSYFGEGKINAKGYGPTGTLTWYGNNGFYTDGQAHFIWYDSDLFSKTAHQSLKNNNDGNAYAASIEIGKRIFLNHTHWSLTPQAQWGYYNTAFSQFKDVFGAAISSNQANSLIGRIGLSADYQNTTLNAQEKLERSHFYGIANLYYDFLNEYAITVTTLPFSNQNYPLWGGLGIGGSKNWNNDFFSVFGEASVNTSLSHFSHNYSILGKVGVRIQWD